MTAQRAFLAIALLAGLVAGSLYYVAVQRVGVVVAAQDLTPDRAIAASDVELRALPPDAVPAGTLRDAAAAVGRYPKGPVWRGQLMLADAIAITRAAFDSGLVPPTGYRAVAIPVSSAQALGGAVVPGARVDVLAVPVQGRAPAGRATELLVAAALVIDVRGEHGGAFDRRAPRQQAVVARERLGSVVIAVGPSDELLIADRIGTSSFVLVLVPERP